MTNYQLFLRFLKYNNIYYTFFENINFDYKYLYDHKIVKITKLSITQAFYWASTKQGEKFWGEVNEKWCTLMLTLQLKDINVEQLKNKDIMELLKKYKVNWG